MASSYITFINTNAFIDVGYDTYVVDANANSITLTLQAIITDGMNMMVRRIDSNSANAVTVVGQNGELINSYTQLTLSPNSMTKFNSLNGAWFTMNPIGRNNEIKIVFNQLIGTQTSRPYVLINNSVFTSLGFFKYHGRKYYGIGPLKFVVVYSIDSDIPDTVDFSIQLQDVTNTAIISTIGPINQIGTSATYFIESTTIFNNISELESMIEIDGRINSGTVAVRLHSIELVLN